MTRLFYSTATASTSSHLALVESELPFEKIEVSWEKKLNLRELKAANPFEAVPTLIASDGKVLTQNLAILEYAADQVPARRLLAPPGSWERREALSWMAFTSAEFQRSFLPLGEADTMVEAESAREEIRAYQRKRIAECLQHINESLHGREYLVGSGYTVADIHLYCSLNWCEWFEIPFDPYSNIQAYRTRLLKRPAVRKVMEAEGLI